MEAIEGLEPPPSIVRLLAFLESLGVPLQGAEEPAKAPIGIGYDMLRMVLALVERTATPLALLSLTGYSLTMGTREVADLRQWLVRTEPPSEDARAMAVRGPSPAFREAAPYSRTRRPALAPIETEEASFVGKTRRLRPSSPAYREENAESLAAPRPSAPGGGVQWIDGSRLTTLLLAEAMVARMMPRTETEGTLPSLVYGSPRRRTADGESFPEEGEGISKPRFLQRSPFEAFRPQPEIGFSPSVRTGEVTTPALAFARTVEARAKGVASTRGEEGAFDQNPAGVEARATRASNVPGKARTEPLGQAAQAALRAWPSADPRYGSLTLVAPPLRIASAKEERVGAAAELEWPKLQRHLAPLGPSDVERLQAMLPPGTQALYPSLPAASLGPSAFNVPLDAQAIESLVVDGFGPLPPMWADSAAMRLPQAPAMPLVARYSPYGTPGGYGDMEEPTANPVMLGGLPVSVPARLTDEHPLAQTHAMRGDLRAAPSPVIRPGMLPQLGQRISPAFHHLRAEPDIPAWNRAGRPLPIGISPVAMLSRTAAFAPPSYAPVVTRIAPVPIAMPGGPTIRMAAPAFTPTISPSPAVPKARSAIPIRMAMPSAISEPIITRPPVSVRPSHGTPSMPAPAAPLTMNMGDMLSPPSPVSFPEARSEPRIGAGSPSIVRTGMPALARPIQFDANVDVRSSPVSAPSSTVMAKRPAMSFSSRPMAEDSLVVQRAGSSPTAPVSGASSPAGGSSAAGGGAKPDDVSLLAGEVWSILKRRLAFEAQRAGRSQRLR